MFLVLALALFSAHVYGGSACGFKDNPPPYTYSIANVGENVTLGCHTDINSCDRSQCRVIWQRKVGLKTFHRLSSCSKKEDGVEDMFSMSGGPDWSLNIVGVQADVDRDYRCKIRSENETISDIEITLILRSDINVTVQSSRASPVTSGDAVTFCCNCKVRATIDVQELTYQWSMNGGNMEHFNNVKYSFSTDGQSLTIQSVTTAMNDAEIKCSVSIGTPTNQWSATNLITSGAFILQVTQGAQPVSITSSETKIWSINPYTDKAANITDQSIKDNRSPVTVTEGVEPTPIQTNPQPILPEISTIKPVFITNNLLVGVGVVLTVIIIILSLVFRRRRMIRSGRLTSRGDDQTDAVESAETQLIKSAQTLMNSMGVLAKLHRDHGGENTHHCVEVRDVPLPTEISFDCGYKQSTPRSHPVYACVNKSHARNGSKSAPEHSAKVSPKDGPKGDVVSAEKARSDGRDEIQSDQQEPTVVVEVSPVAGSKPGRTPTGQKPPSVTPYHLSKTQTHTGTEAKSEPPEQTADRGGDGTAKGDPRLRNAEGLIYADLDLSRASPRIVSSVKEVTHYSGIVNKELIRNLREGSIHEKTRRKCLKEP